MTKLPTLGKETLLQELEIKTKQFLKKVPTRQSVGAIKGHIPSNASTSSPIGRMIKNLTH